MACAFRNHCDRQVACESEPSALLDARKCVTCPAIGEAEVHVSRHALNRLFERDPGHGGVSSIKADVCAALREGRVADIPPPMSLVGPKRAVEPGHAYAWPAKFELLYVLVEGRYGGLVVKTVLPRELEWSAA